jgi:hypothetical protein
MVTSSVTLFLRLIRSCEDTTSECVLYFVLSLSFFLPLGAAILRLQVSWAVQQRHNSALAPSKESNPDLKHNQCRFVLGGTGAPTPSRKGKQGFDKSGFSFLQLMPLTSEPSISSLSLTSSTLLCLCGAILWRYILTLLALDQQPVSQVRLAQPGPRPPSVLLDKLPDEGTPNPQPRPHNNKPV